MFAGFDRPSTSAASSSKTPCHIDPFIRNTILETTCGDFWLIKMSGEDWPVVIGDEEIVSTIIKTQRRPRNARQADGDWSNAYKFGGVDEDKRCYPTVFLGSYLT